MMPRVADRALRRDIIYAYHTANLFLAGLAHNNALVKDYDAARIAELERANEVTKAVVAERRVSLVRMADSLRGLATDALGAMERILPVLEKLDGESA